MEKAIYGAVIENEAAYYAAAKRNIIANAQKTFRRSFEDAQAIEDFIAAGRVFDDYGRVSYADNFVGSLAKAFDNFGKLTPKQVEAVRKSIAQRAARKAEWAAQDAALNAQRRWLGEVGDKVVVELTLKKAIVIGEFQQYRWSPVVLRYLLILEDAERNVVIYRGNSNAMPFNEGDSVKVKATIKECGVREGVKQTVIERPKAVA